MIRAVFWDLGGVILRTKDWTSRNIWEDRLGLERGHLQRLVFRSEVGQRAMVGQATEEQVWEYVFSELELDAEAQSAIREDFWQGDRLDHDLVAYIRSLQSTYKTGLISNAWLEVRKEIEDDWAINDAFDDMVISAEVEIAKPDPRIYELALDRLGVQPEQSVFLDDFQRNVEGAIAVGMQAIQFREREQALDELKPLLADGSG